MVIIELWNSITPNKWNNNFKLSISSIISIKTDLSTCCIVGRLKDGIRMSFLGFGWVFWGGFSDLNGISKIVLDRECEVWYNYI